MLQIGLDTTQIQSKQITAKLREATGGVAHTIASIHLKQHTATAVPVKKSTGYITVDSVVATHVGPEDDAVRHCISLGTYLALLGEVKTKKCNPAPTRGSDANKSSFEDVTTWKRTTPQSA